MPPSTTATAKDPRETPVLVWWRLGEAVTLLVLLVGLGYLFFAVEADQDFAQLRAQAQDHLLPALLLLTGLVAIGFPPPLVALCCGTLLPFLIALPCALGLATLGGLLTFLIGRLFRSDHRRPERSGRLQKLRRFTRQASWRAVLVLRLLPPLPFAVMNYSFGRLGTSAPAFIGGTLLGLLPGMTLICWLGLLAFQSIDAGLFGLSPQALLLLLALPSLLIMGLLWWRFQTPQKRGTTRRRCGAQKPGSGH